MSDEQEPVSFEKKPILEEKNTHSKDALSPEIQKRRREKKVALVLSVAFVLSTLLQAFITGRREAYGFVQSLLYFALVHLNVILIMFLVFLVSRNLIKAYAVRRSGKLGSTLRWKMVTSLLGFSLFPSVILFVGSSYVIREGFDRWFSGQVSTALEDAQTITQVHYQGIENNLSFYAGRVVEIYSQNNASAERFVSSVLRNYPVEAVELYSSLSSNPKRVLKEGVPEWSVPRAAVESLQRAFEGAEFSLIRQFGDDDLVQHFKSVPKPWGGYEVIVLSQTVPLGLKTRIADLRTAFSGYSKALTFKDSIKTNYTLVLLTLFVLVLFVVSWFGLYIAKSVTDPVAELMKATEAFRAGDWAYRIKDDPALTQEKLQGFGADLQILMSAFNTMAGEVGSRGRKLEEANAQLISLVRELEDRERYLEILLSSIRRGVVVLDPEARLQRINNEALAFSSDSRGEPWLAAEAVGKNWQEVFSHLLSVEDFAQFLEESRHFRGNPLDRIFEMKIGVHSEASLRSIRATGISLLDDTRQSLGWLIIFEDVSDAARLERLAAWQEVARRVAHEIKNPLTPIQISADRLARRLSGHFEDGSDEARIFGECVGQIQKQVRVIRDLVREFSQFAKLPEPNFTTVDLGALLEKQVADYRFTHPNTNWQLVQKDIHQPLLVRGDAEYLRRLVVNLFDNALHSLEESKTLNPSVLVEIQDTKTTSSFVSVLFEDNGPGIPVGLRDKIFDPYVTSRASGLGLGLPIVRRIAIEHAGRIRCEESSRGARFVLELPLLNMKDIL